MPLLPEVGLGFISVSLTRNNRRSIGEGLAIPCRFQHPATSNLNRIETRLKSVNEAKPAEKIPSSVCSVGIVTPQCPAETPRTPFLQFFSARTRVVDQGFVCSHRRKNPLLVTDLSFQPANDAEGKNKKRGGINKKFLMVNDVRRRW